MISIHITGLEYLLYHHSKNGKLYYGILVVIHIQNIPEKCFIVSGTWLKKSAMRIYSKQIHNHKIIRAELQFNPDIFVKELIMRIILNSSTENT